MHRHYFYLCLFFTHIFIKMTENIKHIKQFKEIFWITQYHKDETLTSNLLDKLTCNSADRLQLVCQTMSKHILVGNFEQFRPRQLETLFYNQLSKNAVTQYLWTRRSFFNSFWAVIFYLLEKAQYIIP